MNAKTLREKAHNLYKDAMAKREEYKDVADIPQEVLDNINEALDEVESLTQKADSIERMDEMRKSFRTPANDLPLNGGSDEEGLYKSPELGREVKALADMAGIPTSEQKVSQFSIDAPGGYDPDRALAKRIAVAMLWKYGEKDFSRMVAKMPAEFASMSVQLKDLATEPGGAGGYLVADTQLNRLIEQQANVVAMRRIANVLPPIPGGSAVTPSEDTELSDPEWTTEIGTGSDDTVHPFGERALTPHPLAKRIKISRTLLRAATLLNVENWVLSRLARKFDDAEENAFINGNGSQKPMGLLSATLTSTTSASGAVEADDVINWAYSLPSAYAPRAIILCNRSFVRKLRLLRDDSGGAGTGQYLWQPGLSQGNPPTILDWRYEVSDFYPTGLVADAYQTGEIVATIGDFSYYWIVDSLNFEVQRLEELYAATNQVGFIGRKESDGMVVAAEAFHNLEIG